MRMTSRYFLLLCCLVVFAACNKDDGPDIPDLPDESDEVGPAGSTIPYFVIETGGATIVDEPKIPANMAIYINQQRVFQNPIGVEFRGATSQRIFPKKSFGIETWTPNGEDMDTEILDFAAEEDWILQGPYSDKTLIRNALIYDIANEMGEYAVKTRFAEVEVNGNYEGVYVFMEKIKRDANRLDLLRLEQGQTHPDVISGGYILKIDKTTGDTGNPDWPGDFTYTENLGFRSDYNPSGQALDYPAYGDKRGEETYFLYEYPDADFINDAQKQYIQGYISDFEEALLSDNFIGDERAYEDFIDVQSFVDFFILNELSANPDAYRLSTFMHKDRNEKLRMGPIWDFNLAFGNDGRSAIDTWIYQYNQNNPGDLWLVHFWWDRLLADSKFRGAVKARWNSLKSTVLNASNLNGKIDAWIAELEQNGAIDRNYQRWPVIGVPLPFNSVVGATFEDEITFAKNWVSARIDWMDSQIQGW